MNSEHLSWLSSLPKASATVKIADPLLHDELVRRSTLLLCGGQLGTLPSQIYLLHRKAIRGEPESVYKLAGHYQNGNEVQEDLYLAFRLLRYAADQNHEPAFAELGKCYAYAIGTQRNYEQAAYCFSKIDYSGDINILSVMGFCYLHGLGVPKDEHRAYDLWIDAAEHGHPENIHLCLPAAEAGYARGQYILGHYYQLGIGTPPDIHKAIELFHQAAAQSYGHL